MPDSCRDGVPDSLAGGPREQRLEEGAVAFDWGEAQRRLCCSVGNITTALTPIPPNPPLSHGRPSLLAASLLDPTGPSSGGRLQKCCHRSDSTPHAPIDAPHHHPHRQVQESSSRRRQGQHVFRPSCCCCCCFPLLSSLLQSQQRRQAYAADHSGSEQDTAVRAVNNSSHIPTPSPHIGLCWSTASTTSSTSLKRVRNVPLQQIPPQQLALLRPPRPRIPLHRRPARSLWHRRPGPLPHPPVAGWIKQWLQFKSQCRPLRSSQL